MQLKEPKDFSLLPVLMTFPSRTGRVCRACGPQLLFPFSIEQVSLKRLTRFVALPELPPNRITNLDEEAAADLSNNDTADKVALTSSTGKDVMLRVEKSDFRWAGPPPEDKKADVPTVKGELKRTCLQQMLLRCSRVDESLWIRISCSWCKRCYKRQRSFPEA